MKPFLMIAALVVSSPSMALDVLDFNVRYTWPPNTKTVSDIVSSAIEPFGYRLILSTDTAIDIGRQRPANLPQPLKRTTVREFILSVLPPDGVILIDTDDQLISFSRFIDE